MLHIVESKFRDSSKFENRAIAVTEMSEKCIDCAVSTALKRKPNMLLAFIACVLSLSNALPISKEFQSMTEF